MPARWQFVDCMLLFFSAYVLPTKGNDAQVRFDCKKCNKINQLSKVLTSTSPPGATFRLARCRWGCDGFGVNRETASPPIGRCLAAEPLLAGDITTVPPHRLRQTRGIYVEVEPDRFGACEGFEDHALPMAGVGLGSERLGAGKSSGIDLDGNWLGHVTAIISLPSWRLEPPPIAGPRTFPSTDVRLRATEGEAAGPCASAWRLSPMEVRLHPPGKMASSIRRVTAFAMHRPADRADELAPASR